MAELHAEVIALLDDVDDGEVLDELSLSLVNLAAVASPDLVPTHRFLPTLRIHVRQAVLAGAGGRALRQVLDVAASTTLHPGVR